MLKDFKAMAELVKANPVKKRIVLCCAHDEHSLDAVYEAYKEGIVTPVFVGKEDEIKAICKENGFDFGDVKIYNEDDDVEAAKTAVRLIREGEGDFLMKGKMQTADLLRQDRTAVRQDHVTRRSLPGTELSQGSRSDRRRNAACT